MECKDIGVDSRSLLQSIFPSQGSKPGLPHCRQILYHRSHQRSPPVTYRKNPNVLMWDMRQFGPWFCLQLYCLLVLYTMGNANLSLSPSQAMLLWAPFLCRGWEGPLYTLLFIDSPCASPSSARMLSSLCSFHKGRQEFSCFVCCLVPTFCQDTFYVVLNACMTYVPSYNGLLIYYVLCNCIFLCAVNVC